MYKEMLQKQKELNLDICRKFDLNMRDLVEEYTVALLVEVGELANETKCFKFWREDRSTVREKILEEASDVFHFILSLVILYEMEDLIVCDFNEVDRREVDLTKQFLGMYNSISALNMGIVNSKIGMWRIMNSFVRVCHLLEITQRDLYENYLKKNQVNISRQSRGY